MSILFKGVVVAGGGERNGIEGIVVGILIGSPDGKFGNGGSVFLGIVGTVGKLGSGGSCVAGLGRDGWLFGKLWQCGLCQCWERRQRWQLCCRFRESWCSIRLQKIARRYGHMDA